MLIPTIITNNCVLYFQVPNVRMKFRLIHDGRITYPKKIEVNVNCKDKFFLIIFETHGYGYYVWMNYNIYWHVWSPKFRWTLQNTAYTSIKNIASHSQKEFWRSAREHHVNKWQVSERVGYATVGWVEYGYLFYRTWYGLCVTRTSLTVWLGLVSVSLTVERRWRICAGQI